MISVCIATYNGEKYIKEQLQSILCQLTSDDEVIISDDGSTDHTLSIIQSLKDKRIKVIDGLRLHSPTFNFEHAIKQAQGDYIFLADQDDVWAENKVAVCCEWLQKYECVVSDAYVTDELLHVTSPSLFKMLHVRSNKLYNTLLKNGYTGCCMAFSRKIRAAVLPFPKEIPMHDIWIGNVAAYKYNIAFIHMPLVYFRRHPNANSCNGKGSKYSRWQQWMFRWNIIKNLLRKKTCNNNTHRRYETQHHHTYI